MAIYNTNIFDLSFVLFSCITVSSNEIVWYVSCLKFVLHKLHPSNQRVTANTIHITETKILQHTWAAQSSWAGGAPKVAAGGGAASSAQEVTGSTDSFQSSCTGAGTSGFGGGAACLRYNGYILVHNPKVKCYWLWRCSTLYSTYKIQTLKFAVSYDTQYINNKLLSYIICNTKLILFWSYFLHDILLADFYTFSYLM